MINVHKKYPEGAVNKAAYSTDGSNVRDATEKEKVRYRDANKHHRKKVDEKSTSSEPSQSGTVASALGLLKGRSTSIRTERGEGDASSGDRSGVNWVKDKKRENARKGKNTVARGRAMTAKVRTREEAANYEALRERRRARANQTRRKWTDGTWLKYKDESKREGPRKILKRLAL